MTDVGKILTCLLTIGSLAPPTFGREPLKAVGSQNYPPYTFLEDGFPKGITVDLVQALAHVMDREIRIELMPWSLAQERVLQGHADFILDLTISEARKKKWDFTLPTMTRSFGFFVRSEDSAIQGIPDLSGKQVGVLSGGFVSEFLDEEKTLNLVPMATPQSGLERLQRKSLDAMATDIGIAGYYLRKHHIRGVSLAGKPFATVDAAFALRKGNQDLVEELNRALQILQQQGTTEKIRNSWENEEVVLFSRQEYQRSIMVALGILGLVVLAALAAWVISLKRHIRIRHKIEDQLRSTEERFRTLFEKANDAIFLMEGDRIMECNSCAPSLLGCQAKSDLIGRTPMDFSPERQPDGGNSWVQGTRFIHAALEGTPQLFEWRFLTKDGQPVDFEVSMVALGLGGKVFLQAIFRNIHKRKQAELALAESQAFLSAILDSTSDHIWTIEPKELKLLTFNKALRNHFHDLGGIDLQIGMRPDQWLPSDRVAFWRELYMRAVKEEHFHLETDYSTSMGKKILLISLHQLKCNNQVFGISVFANDITDRKRTEKALRESEEKYRLIFDHAADAIIILDIQGRILAVNTMTCERLGYTPAELTTMTIYQVDFPEPEVNVPARIASVRKQGLDTFETDHKRKDGSVIPVDISTCLIAWDGQPAIMTICHDLTERKAPRTKFAISRTTWPISLTPCRRFWWASMRKITSPSGTAGRKSPPGSPLTTPLANLSSPYCRISVRGLMA